MRRTRNQQAPRLGAAAEDLETALRSKIRGEVRFDEGSRTLYATDLSMYRQVPIEFTNLLRPFMDHTASAAAKSRSQ